MLCHIRAIQLFLFTKIISISNIVYYCILRSDHVVSAISATLLSMVLLVATAGMVNKDKETLTLVILSTMSQSKFKPFNRYTTNMLNTVVKGFNDNQSTSWHSDYQLQTR